MRPLLLSATILIVLAGCNEDNTDKNRPSGTTPSPPPASSPTTTPPASSPTTSPPPAGAKPVAADNTGRNARDDGTTLTPIDQGTSATDLTITKSVRQAVIANKGISVKGQNVKIIARDGVVTLRGPVESEAERSTIVAIAEKVPEVRVVVNHLEIAAP